MNTYRIVSNDHIPQFGVDPKGARITADEPDADDILQIVSHRFGAHNPFLSPPTSEYEVCTWVGQAVLRTATRILHVSDPNTLAWNFAKVVGKGTQQILSDLVWESRPSPNSDDALRRLVVEVKTPCTPSLYIPRAWAYPLTLGTMGLPVLQKFVGLETVRPVL